MSNSILLFRGNTFQAKNVYDWMATAFMKYKDDPFSLERQSEVAKVVMTIYDDDLGVIKKTPSGDFLFYCDQSEINEIILGTGAVFADRIKTQSTQDDGTGGNPEIERIEQMLREYKERESVK